MYQRTASDHRVRIADWNRRSSVRWYEVSPSAFPAATVWRRFCRLLRTSPSDCFNIYTYRTLWWTDCNLLNRESDILSLPWKREAVYTADVRGDEEMRVEIRQLNLIDLAPGCAGQHVFILIQDHRCYPAAQVFPLMLMQNNNCNFENYDSTRNLFTRSLQFFAMCIYCEKINPLRSLFFFICSLRTLLCFNVFFLPEKNTSNKHLWQIKTYSHFSLLHATEE